MIATGTFDVTMTPQRPDNPDAEAAGLGRMALDKRFHGALEAESHGEMLAFGGEAGSGGYVAIEKVTGTLAGRTGSFALLHRALMRGGTPEHWAVLVIPGTGTGELAGIDGEMTLTESGGQHGYSLAYTLPE